MNGFVDNFEATMMARTMSPAIAVRVPREISLSKRSLYFHAITWGVGNVFFEIMLLPGLENIKEENILENMKEGFVLPGNHLKNIG